MALFERDDIRINYEVSGDGFPLLLIAPGGMNSVMAAWDKMPWNPRRALADDYQLIAMDQRNAGASWAPVAATDGWDTYTADQLALVDHLGIDRFGLVGMCIGGPYLMGLCRAVPQRVAAAVMLQPIGLDDNRDAFLDMFNGWADAIAAEHPEADEAAWDSFRSNMYGGDFMFNTSQAEAASVQTPILVAQGDDLYHPESTSRALEAVLPNVTYLETWKDESVLDQTDEAIHAFLADHCAT